MNNAPYNQFGAAILRPGMATESDALHTVGTFAPNPINSTANFAGSVIAFIPNSTYRVITVDATGSTRVGSTYNSGSGVFDVTAFNAWFSAAIAPLFTLITPPSVWNTAASHTVVANISNSFYLNNNTNVNLAIERTTGGVSSLLTLANIAPLNNNGLSSFSAGRLMVRDLALENTLSTNPALANFASRITRLPIKPLDLQHFQTFGFRGFVGIAAVNTSRSTPHRQPNDGYQIYDTVRVWRRGSVLARNASSAAFNNQISGAALLVELNAPGQIGTITNVNPSGTAVPIPDFALQVVNTRSYPGATEVRLLGAS